MKKKKVIIRGLCQENSKDWRETNGPFLYTWVYSNYGSCMACDMTLVQIHLVSNVSMNNFIPPLLHDRKNVFTMLQQISQSQSSSSCSILHETLKYSLEQIESIENESIALGLGTQLAGATPECQYLFKWIFNYLYKIEQLQ